MAARERNPDVDVMSGAAPELLEVEDAADAVELPDELLPVDLAGAVPLEEEEPL